LQGTGTGEEALLHPGDEVHPAIHKIAHFGLLEPSARLPDIQEENADAERGQKIKLTPLSQIILAALVYPSTNVSQII
jgi:hypothetical protein